MNVLGRPKGESSLEEESVPRPDDCPAGLTLFECCHCGHRVYRSRVWCPACHRPGAREARVALAEVVAWTHVQHGAQAGAVLATVRVLPDGPALIARMEGMPEFAGQRLRLDERPTQGVMLPWAAVISAKGSRS